jgi:formate/nitrite transporter FocA (FNT family)
MRESGTGPPGLIDPYAPPEMAVRAAASGATKARIDGLSLFTLAVLAGVFIALGAQLATLVSVAPGLVFGPARLLTGLAFSLGLILVVIAGAAGNVIGGAVMVAAIYWLVYLRPGRGR